MVQLPQIWSFVALLGVHWVADFVLQTHWQATNKSKNNVALLHHVTTYTAVFSIGALVLFGAAGGPFAAVNGILHFSTDYCTSRATSRLYAKQDYHNFFVVIGFDQLIHQTTIAATMWLMVS